LIYPNNGSVVNPLRLMQAIAALFVESGGQILHQQVMRLLPHEGGYRVLMHQRDLRFPKVLVAAGAWSQRILEPLGVKVPLETERGYHMQLMGDSVNLSMPLLFRSRGFSA